MSKDNPMILADFFLAKAEANPDHRILTFEGGGVRDDQFMGGGCLTILKVETAKDKAYERKTST